MAGSWFEVWDKYKKPVYMRQFQMPYMFEAHGEKESITRQAVAAELVPPIELIIPDLNQAIYVLLYTTVDHRRGKHATGTGGSRTLPFAMFLRAENN